MAIEQELMVIEQIASAVLGAIAFALVSEWFLRPRPSVRIIDISLLPRFNAASEEKTRLGVREWVATVGRETRVPIEDEFLSMVEASARFPSLKPREKAEEVHALVELAYTLRRRFPSSRGKATELLRQIESRDVTRRDQLRIAEEIVSDVCIEAEIVGSLRREEITLQPGVDESWKQKHEPIFVTTDFSEMKNGAVRSGYVLRFPTFTTRVEIEGDRTELPLLKPYVEILQYFHVDTIKDMLTKAIALLTEGENEAVRVSQKLGDVLNPLNILAVKVRIENRGGSKLTAKPDSLLHIGVPGQKGFFLPLVPLKEPEIVIEPRTGRDLTLVSRPFAEAKSEQLEIVDLLLVRRVLSAGICFETLGHGPLGIRKYLCSGVQRLGEEIKEKELEALKGVASSKLRL